MNQKEYNIKNINPISNKEEAEIKRWGDEEEEKRKKAEDELEKKRKK